MKKIYLSFLFFILFFAAIAQPTTERYWVGGTGTALAGGDFTLSNNWALTSGGTPGASFAPGGSVEVNYIFDVAGTYYISTPSVIASMGFITLKAGVILNFDYLGNNVSAVNQNLQGVDIATGAKLTVFNKNINSGTYFWAFTTAPGYASTISGEMVLEATTKSITFGTGSFQPMLTIKNNGILRLNGSSLGNANLSSTTSTLTVDNGGSIYLNNNSGSNFTGNFDANSTLFIEGPIQTTSTTNKLSSSIACGNVVVNVPNNTVGFPIFFGGGNTIKGNLTIKNTGTKHCTNTNAGATAINTINGNFLLSNEGNTTTPKFQYFNSPSTNTSSQMNINGNLETQPGTILDLGCNGNGLALSTINLKGNLTLNGSTTESSLLPSMPFSRYTFTLNGLGTQVLSGIGAQSNDLQFFINKTSGIVNLGSDFNTSSSPDAVFVMNYGKINGNGFKLIINTVQFNAGLKGNINSYLYNGTILWRNLGASVAGFSFPVGNETDYFPANIYPTANNTDFSVRFYKPNTFLPLTGPAGIDVISDYYWDIQVPSGTASANSISLGYTSLLAGVLDYNQVKVAHYNGSTMAWENFGGTATGGQTGCPASNTCGFINSVTTPITTFSPFTLAGPATTLSLKIENFNAIKQFNGAAINWQVPANSNASKFELLKSTDGIIYQNLTTVYALASKTNYNYFDANLINGGNYYKLKIIEQNGAISYSTVAIVYFSVNGIETASLVPTIVKNNATLTFTSTINTMAKINITDINGRIVYNNTIALNAGNNIIDINTLNFAQGQYFLNILSKNGNNKTIKFIKNF